MAPGNLVCEVIWIVGSMPSSTEFTVLLTRIVQTIQRASLSVKMHCLETIRSIWSTLTLSICIYMQKYLYPMCTTMRMIFRCCTSVRQQFWSSEFGFVGILFSRVHPIVRRLRSFRLKRFKFYANFAKLKRRLRSFRLTRFEVYANFARTLSYGESLTGWLGTIISKAVRALAARLV